MRKLAPREKRVVGTALFLALLVSLAWIAWLAQLRVEEDALPTARLWLALVVFGAHFLAGVVVLLKRPFDPANRALFPFLTILGVLNAGRIVGAVTFETVRPHQVAFVGMQVPMKARVAPRKASCGCS